MSILISYDVDNKTQRVEQTLHPLVLVIAINNEIRTHTMPRGIR